MKQTHNHYKTRKPIRPLLLIVGAIVLLIVVAVLIVFATKPSHTKDSTTDKPTISKFSFTGSGKWHQGSTNGTSMVLFSPKLSDGTSACFTSTEYYDGVGSAAAKLANDRATIESGGHAVKSIGTPAMSIKTNSGVKQYKLHQYKVTSPKSTSDVLGGHELGYLQLDGGYLKIYGNCNTAGQLSSTLPALRAVKFNLHP